MGSLGGKGGDALRRRDLRLARIAAYTLATMAMLAAVGAYRIDAVEAQRLETVLVSILVDGVERQVRTAQTTVVGTLKEVGVQLGQYDVVKPSKNERLKDGMKIEVVHVRTAIETVKEPIAYKTKQTFVHTLRPGVVKETQSGVSGEKALHYRVRYEGGVEVQRTLIGAVVVKKPVDRVVTIGSKGRYTSRGEFTSRKVLRMSATAYDPGPRSCGPRATGRTSCGLKAGYGVVAVDPRVIALGTKLYIEGYGYAVAGDTGRSIKGNKIDLGFNTYREAINFGRRAVTVHLLKE